jgi:hypothetical protein
MADEVLHELSVPQSQRQLTPAEKLLTHEVAVPPSTLLRGCGQETCSSQRRARTGTSLSPPRPPPPPCAAAAATVQLEIETHLALHVAEEQGANKHLVQLEPQFLHHNVAPRTLHPKFWCFLVALERRSAALVVRRSASLSPARARPRRRCRRGTCRRAARSETLRPRDAGNRRRRQHRRKPTPFTPSPQSLSDFSHPFALILGELYVAHAG